MKKYRFKIRLLPVILFTAFVILIVRVHSYNFKYDTVPDTGLDSSSQLWDFFSYTKSAAIFAIAIYAALTMAYLLMTEKIKIKKTSIYIPMLVYTAGVVISYAMSDYKWMAFNGGVARFEGTRTILCYIFMLFYTINVVEDIQDALTVIMSTIASTFICCLIGVTQLARHDFLLTDIAKFMISGTNHLDFNATFEPGQVYQTVANMNYVGMYLALTIPVLVYGVIYLLNKKNTVSLYSFGINHKKQVYIISGIAILLVLIVLNLVGSASLGGFLGITAALTVLFLVLDQKKWHRITVLAVIFTAFIVILLIEFVTGLDDHERTGHKQIDFIETGVDIIKMSIDGEVVSLVYDRENDSYEYLDDEGNSIKTFWFADEEGIYQLEDSRFGGRIQLIPFKDINGEACLAVDVMDIDWQTFGFTYYEDGAKYLNPFGKEVSLRKIDSIGFKGHLTSGSGRGYVWSRTLPLLKNSIIWGTGADTFMLIFPNDDYAGKYSSGTALHMTCDKPHSLYLNMAVGTGIVSLLAFLAMIVMAMIKVFRLKNDKILVKITAAGIIGFLVAGLFNDSNVCIMPMFYGLLGTVIGMSIEK